MTSIKTERILENPKICIDHAGDGELLVLMHGIGGNRSNWTEQVEAFSPHFHTVAWDARGYGDSDDYAGRLDFEDFSRDLLGLLDHFGAEKAHLCGLSMGGRIAQDFYRMYPSRVKSLLLVATFAGFKRLSEPERQRFVELRLKPLKEGGKEPKDIAPVVAKTLIGPNAPE
ncbi:MAG: alpha/beta fold hydrolase, partial [Pseudomonadota bacterium]|nr:alpha/beta fold hydrolase [Pseudomonadota bacterium]